MRTPPSLRKGDTIGIAAPARKISREEMLPAIAIIENQGFRIRSDEAVFNEFHQYSGTDSERIAHFQSLLDDPEIKAIICARGGYGAIRVIDKLDFSKFMQNPKWIAGYSDITVFHAHLNEVLQTESLHATMPVNFATNTVEALQSLFDALNGTPLNYKPEPHFLNHSGSATGQLVGGNLSILYSLAGSPDFPDTKGKILFLEDLDEYLYHIDRMILGLKRMGVFDQLSGLIVGGLTEMKDNAVPFGKTALEIVAEHITGFDFPVCFGFPAGHIPDNRALIFGRDYQFDVGDKVTLREIPKR
ncbi:MAG: LD-carboxypeptidase [Bacteroidales bacterium]|nr:LD-carboxypeptidase [Bacteroidales bacterium]